ncbi:Triose-phosphate Transporter [Tulasnella sp. 403]|nr:Triose-phosphate Transporter [Tulasnella sp. 403]
MVSIDDDGERARMIPHGRDADEDEYRRLHAEMMIDDLNQGAPVTSNFSSLDASSSLGSGIRARSRKWWRDAFVNSLFIASWFAFATLLSLYNRWMFSGDFYNFPFPLFVTTMHMATQFVAASIVRMAWPNVFNPPGRPTVPEYIKKCIPCGVTTGLDIGLSNLSIKIITLSLYTMCKSSSLVFVLLFAFLFRLERFSWRLVGVIFFITAGVLLMVLSTKDDDKQSVSDPSPAGSIPTLNDEPDDNIIPRVLLPVMKRALVQLAPRFIPDRLKTPTAVGVILVLAASAFGGLRWALTQLLLTGAHGHGQRNNKLSKPLPRSDDARQTMGLNNPAATIFWLAPTMFFTLLIVAFFVEGPFPRTLTDSGFFDTFWGGLQTIGYIFFPGIIAFAMVMSEYYIIQRTGIVPMSIAGIFKEVTTILLSTSVLHESSLTLINWIGLIITFAGIVIFTHHKYKKSVEEGSPIQESQDIDLPPYTPVIDTDDGDAFDKPSGIIPPRAEGYSDVPRGSEEGDYLRTDLSGEGRSLLFDADREDEVGSRRTGAVPKASHNQEQRFSDIFDDDHASTPLPTSSEYTSPRRKRDRKDLKVRFNVADDAESQPQRPPVQNTRPLDFR